MMPRCVPSTAVVRATAVLEDNERVPRVLRHAVPAREVGLRVVIPPVVADMSVYPTVAIRVLVTRAVSCRTVPPMSVSTDFTMLTSGRAANGPPASLAHVTPAAGRLVIVPVSEANIRVLRI